MKKLIFAASLLAAGIVAVGCSGRNHTSNPVCKEEAHPTQRRTVAVVPMTITVKPAVAWEVDNEMMSAISTHLGTSKYVECGFTEVPKEQDFVVSMELVDHEVGEDALKTGINVQVVDMRGDLPQVISDETITSEHHIPKANHLIDYTQVKWGSTEYVHTPVCVAHARVARDVSSHVEQTINRA